MKCLVHSRPSKHGHYGSPNADPTPASYKGTPSLGLGLGVRTLPQLGLLQSQTWASVSLWQPWPAMKPPTLNITQGGHLSEFLRIVE